MDSSFKQLFLSQSRCLPPVISQRFGLVVVNTVGNNRVVSSHYPEAAGNAADCWAAGTAAVVALVALFAVALVGNCGQTATSEDPQGSPRTTTCRGGSGCVGVTIWRGNWL